MLQIDAVTKRFAGLTALDAVSLEIRAGEIFALIGPNGAGKTTLFNVVSGLLRADGGRVLYDGRDVTAAPPHDLARLGLARTFQNIRLFPNLNVLENVILARHCRTRAGLLDTFLWLPRETRERAESRARAEALLAEVDLAHRCYARATELPYGEMRRLEIARALALEPQTLLLDEPSAGMNSREIDELIELIAKVRTGGRTVFLIEHNMPLVMQISDRVAVLNFGLKIAEGTPAEIQSDQRVIDAYLGTG